MSSRKKFRKVPPRDNRRTRISTKTIVFPQILVYSCVTVAKENARLETQLAVGRRHLTKTNKQSGELDKDSDACRRLGEGFRHLPMWSEREKVICWRVQTLKRTSRLCRGSKLPGKCRFLSMVHSPLLLSSTRQPTRSANQHISVTTWLHGTPWYVFFLFFSG